MATISKQRKTQSLKVFEANLGRAQAFLRIFDKDRGVGQPTNDEKELLRGCLVFAVGALDAYLGDLIVEVVPEIKTRTRALDDALQRIAKDNPGLVLRIALTEDGESRRSEFRSALSAWLENKSFQGSEKVASALNYLGSGHSIADLDEITGVGTAAELDRITKERHQIVHKGTKPYTKRDLAAKAVDLVQSIAGAIDLWALSAMSAR